MKSIHKPPSRMAKVCFVLIAVVLASWLVVKAKEINHRDKFAAVTLTGTQHLGPDFNISAFYVDGYSGSNVGREGGGGSYVCCVLLPRTWRPGLTAEVRWQVGDWRQEKENEINQGNYDSVRWKNYKAHVPIERYMTAERMYVHFFSGGRVRVFSGDIELGSASYPIHEDGLGAVQRATKGEPIAELFTRAELDEMDRREPKGATWQ